MTPEPPAEASARGPAPRLTWLLGFVIALVTLAAFNRVITSDFVHFDDNINIYDNQNIRGLSASNLYWMFTDFAYTRRYIPLGWLGFAITWTLKGGLDSSLFHWANLLFQAANAVLVFLLLQQVLSAAAKRPLPQAGAQPRLTSPERISLCAALGALLWSLHPLRVEAVAWASGRLYLQASFFLLLSLVCYLHFQGSPPGNRRSLCYWASVLCSALSLLSYPIGLAFLAVIVILDFFPLKRFNPGLRGLFDPQAKQIWLEKVPYLLVLAALFGLTLYARANAGGIWTPPPTFAEFSPGARIMQGFYVWAYYTWKPLVPFHLSPVYTTLVSFNPASWPFSLSAVFVLLTTAVLFFCRRKCPWALALWLCHLALLTPTLGLTEHPHYTSDRYDYLPGLLWAVTVSALFWKLSSQRRLFQAALIASLVLALSLGVLTVNQTRIWHNSVTLFQHMLKELGQTPYRADVHWRLGAYYEIHGDTNAALQQYQLSLQALPSEALYLLSAGLLEKLGDRQGALTNYLGLLQLRQSPLDHVSAGVLLTQLGRVPDAKEHFRAALVLAPHLVPALNNLAWVLATDPCPTNRDGREAVQLAERACALTDRREPALLGTLAAAYAEAGRFPEAIETARSARDFARAAGQTGLVQKNEELLQLYHTNLPYHASPPSP